MPNKSKDNMDIERQGWNAEKLAEEATNKQSDDITREMLRGDETKGNPDERDIAGSSKSVETPQGREEEKQKTGGFQLNG